MLLNACPFCSNLSHTDAHTHYERSWISKWTVSQCLQATVREILTGHSPVPPATVQNNTVFGWHRNGGNMLTYHSSFDFRVASILLAFRRYSVSFIRGRLVIRHKLPLPRPTSASQGASKWQKGGLCQSPAFSLAASKITASVPFIASFPPFLSLSLFLLWPLDQGSWSSRKNNRIIRQLISNIYNSSSSKGWKKCLNFQIAMSCGVSGSDVWSKYF